MLKDQLAVNMKGRVTFLIKDGGKTIRIFRRHNDIQPTAKDIAAKRLIGNPTSVIDTISLYYQGNLVLARSINNSGIVGVAEVFFETTFLPDDFDGNFDAARLTASGLADFSIIGNLVGSKNSTESLLVTWNIQII